MDIEEAKKELEEYADVMYELIEEAEQLMKKKPRGYGDEYIKSAKLLLDKSLGSMIYLTIYGSITIYH